MTASAPKSAPVTEGSSARPANHQSGTPARVAGASSSDVPPFSVDGRARTAMPSAMSTKAARATPGKRIESSFAPDRARRDPSTHECRGAASSGGTRKPPAISSTADANAPCRSLKPGQEMRQLETKIPAAMTDSAPSCITGTAPPGGAGRGSSGDAGSGSYGGGSASTTASGGSEGSSVASTGGSSRAVGSRS